MSKTAANAALREAATSPAFWFARLEIARSESDFETAGDAIRQLRRLGVIVRFRPPQQRTGRAGCREPALA